MKLGSVTKQPGETISYSVTYADAMDVGDHVLSATATSSPAGLTLSAMINNDPIVRMFASAGVNGQNYTVVVTTRTTGGLVYEDEFTIKVKEV